MGLKEEIMKRKHISLMALVPLLGIACSCSTDKGSEPDSPEGGKTPMHVMTSILPSSGETPDGTVAVDAQAERAFNQNRLYFATYNLTDPWGIKDYIMDGQTLNNGEGGVAAHYFVPNWGPSVAMRLDTEQYENGFAVAMFSVPENVSSSSFSIQGKNLKDGAFKINWPVGVDANNVCKKVWVPEIPDPEDNTKTTDFIPMAGIVHVTKEYLKKYNRNVYTGDSPFELPKIQPIRAMAKIVIEDPENLIKTAEITCPDKGILFPGPAYWIDGTLATMPPNQADDAQMITQRLTQPNVTKSDGTKAFVFYSYERSFRRGTDLPANDPGREIITLTSDKIKDNDGNPTSIKVSVAPYTVAGALDTSNAATLMTANNGSWQGVMRNRVYTYTIKSPSSATLLVSVNVKVKDWTKRVQDEEFEAIKDN